MHGHRLRVTCDRCGREVSARTDGSGPVAHRCPHGSECVGPAWSRRDFRPRSSCCVEADRNDDRNAATPRRRVVVVQAHVLRAGFPLCGFTRELPKDWPAGHVWLSEPHFAEALSTKEIPKGLACSTCIERMGARS